MPQLTIENKEEHNADKLLNELAKFFSSSYIAGKRNNRVALEISTKHEKCIYVPKNGRDSFYPIHYFPLFMLFLNWLPRNCADNLPCGLAADWELCWR